MHGFASFSSAELHSNFKLIPDELFKSIARKQAAGTKWRRERDSNPRDLAVTDLAGLLLTRLGNPGFITHPKFECLVY